MSDTANILKGLGGTIRSRRRSLGLTQQDLADLAGVQRQTIGRIESGSGGDVPTLLEVCDALGLSIEVVPVFGGDRS